MKNLKKFMGLSIWLIPGLVVALPNITSTIREVDRSLASATGIAGLSYTITVNTKVVSGTFWPNKDKVNIQFTGSDKGSSIYFPETTSEFSLQLAADPLTDQDGSYFTVYSSNNASLTVSQTIHDSSGKTVSRNLAVNSRVEITFDKTKKIYNGIVFFELPGNTKGFIEDSTTLVDKRPPVQYTIILKQWS